MRSCSIPLMVARRPGPAGSARAGGLVLAAADFDAQPGSTGSFLVTLTNTDAKDATLSDYQIQMTTDVVGLSFTGVAEPMLPDLAYVFPGVRGPISSDFGPPFPTTPVTTFTAVDFSVRLRRLRHAGGGPDVRGLTGQLRGRLDGPAGHGGGLVRQPGLVGV